MNTERNRFFLTSTLAPEMVEKYKLSVATSYFSFNLASGGAFDKVFSILPDTFGGNLEEEILNDKRYEVVYCSGLRKRSRPFRVLAALVEQFRLFRRIPRQSSVWFYNLGDLSFLFFILIRLFKRSVLLNVIVLDYTPPVLWKDRNRFYIKLINKANGIITLSTSGVFKCNNKAILPGVVPNKEVKAPLVSKVNNKFILSGVLSEVIAQISLVLNAFARMPECELHITGFATDDAIIKDFTQRYPNIIYHGKVSYQEYLDILHSCPFQLSTRDGKAPENKCNFPSKIMEALLHNRIIISTIDYPQLSDIKYFKVDSDATAFTKELQEIVNKSQEELMCYANQSNAVKERFSPKVWEEKMYQIEQNAK